MAAVEEGSSGWRIGFMWGEKAVKDVRLSSQSVERSGWGGGGGWELRFVWKDQELDGAGKVLVSDDLGEHQHSPRWLVALLALRAAAT